MKLAVIPARGGSKRIPRKNIKSFFGKPMISYAISTAIESGIFDRIIVSTEDEEITQVARECGAEVPFIRPPELADDHSPTVPVVAHAIRECQSLGWDVQQVCCIYPCNPLLSWGDISLAHQLLSESRACYAFPVANFPSPIQRALRRQHDGTVIPFLPEYAGTRTQDLEPGYYDVGQFYWGKASAWLEGLNVHLHGVTLVIPEWRVVDIDSPTDWERAERLYSSLSKVYEP